MGRRNHCTEVNTDGTHGAACGAGSTAQSSPHQISWRVGPALQTPKTNRSKTTGTETRWSRPRHH